MNNLQIIVQASVRQGPTRYMQKTAALPVGLLERGMGYMGRLFGRGITAAGKGAFAHPISTALGVGTVGAVVGAPRSAGQVDADSRNQELFDDIRRGTSSMGVGEKMLALEGTRKSTRLLDRVNPWSHYNSEYAKAKNTLTGELQNAKDAKDWYNAGINQGYARSTRSGGFKVPGYRSGPYGSGGGYGGRSYPRPYHR